MPTSLAHLATPKEMQQRLAARLKRLRLLAGYKRTTLASRAGVSARTLQRFEDTGDVSLKTLARIAHALGRLPELDRLFHPPEAASIRELEERAEKPEPKRGRF